MTVPRSVRSSLSDTEYAKAVARARAKGLPLAAYVRMLILRDTGADDGQIEGQLTITDARRGR